MSIDLNKFRKNIYTNSGVKPCPGYGEDGVILEIFNNIGVSETPICVEFGELRVQGTTTRAFRIKYLSKALYFSGSLDLKSWYLNILDIIKVSVNYKSWKYLKFLLNMPRKLFASTAEISKIVNKFTKGQQIDLFVVDIDSFDFEIVIELLKSKIRPKVLIVEYNPSLPVHESIYWQENLVRDSTTNKRLYGASYGAWEKLMIEYGYSLIHVSGFCNLHYLRNDIDNTFIRPNILAEVTDTDEKVLKFSKEYCLPGFRPSWLDSPHLTRREIDLLATY
jgi:hypothetical protein